MLELTKQDLFNKAYLGLKSQNWEKCVDENKKTLLVNKEGQRCSVGWWGHQ